MRSSRMWSTGVTNQLRSAERPLRVGLSVELDYQTTADSNTGGLFFAPLPADLAHAKSA